MIYCSQNTPYGGLLHASFSKDDWSYALQELKKPRCLTFGALVCALSIALGSFYLVVGSNLRIYLTFIVKSLGCAVYGPIVGAIVAFLSDTIGFLLFPSGPYFPGYLLSEILAACIYSLFLYRERFHWLRALAAKALVNYLINILLDVSGVISSMERLISTI